MATENKIITAYCWMNKYIATKKISEKGKQIKHYLSQVKIKLMN